MGNNGLVGGFVSSNTDKGTIKDCYCVTKFNGKKFVAGGFAGENRGKIDTSYCNSKAKGLSGGFIGNKSLLGTKCYFLKHGKKESTKAATLWDKDCGINEDQLKSDKDAKSYGFDTDNIWKVKGINPTLQFGEKWEYDNPFEVDPTGKIIKIKDAKNLILFQEMINQGDKRFTKANIQLTADINLGGKKWTPIGVDRKNAFEGVFDGNGHTVSNFVISNEDINRKGFFGYLKGQVYNLNIDCNVKGEGFIGGIASVNEGTIGCCGVVMTCRSKGGEFNFGGLCSVNSGSIFQSYAGTIIKTAVIPILPLCILLSTSTVLGASVYTANRVTESKDKTYKSVDDDKNQKVIGSDEDDTEVASSSIHSMSFEFNEQVDISIADGDVYLDFVNPKTSNNKIVITLALNDEEAMEALGTTGRSEEEQAAYEKTDEYKNGEAGVIIAKSGAVSPGYQLENLVLNDLALDNLKAGRYEGCIYLSPYDVDTNEKAIINTNLPVTLVVK